MPTLANRHTLDELSHNDTPSEFYLETKINTELHIIACSDRTIIKLPYGNKFDIVNGDIIIHEKQFYFFSLIKPKPK